MKQFSDKDFLLNTKTAKALFQNIAGLPIIDCHSKLSPEEIAKNKTFQNITELWLSDPEKQAAMRRYKVEEHYITGEAGDYEKFRKWADVVPSLIGSALYHQTHLELQRIFGIYEPLSPATAERVWNRTSALLCSERFGAFELFKKFNVQLICTPVDVADSLVWHQKIAEEGVCPAKVFPTFSAQKAFDIGSKDFSQWVSSLEEVCSREIKDYFSLQSCLVERLLFFKSVGSKTAILRISSAIGSEPSFEHTDAIFQKAREQKSLSQTEIAEYQAHLLSFLMKKYADYNFTAELELTDGDLSKNTIVCLTQLSKEHALPKIILSCEQCSDYDTLAKAVGSADSSYDLRLGVPSNLSYRKSAIHTVLTKTAEQGLLPKCTGFSTCSDSFLSYPAHEYFRRILCNYLGDLVEAGEYPNYPELLRKFATDIAYRNRKQLLEIEK
ncbi:MAG: glucuronate isomerase [Clostridia bacterium]|nr:glucuronate isomerase [Clostridia bacterium]